MQPPDRRTLSALVAMDGTIERRLMSFHTSYRFICSKNPDLDFTLIDWWGGVRG